MLNLSFTKGMGGGGSGTDPQMFFFNNFWKNTGSKHQILNNVTLTKYT